MIWNEFDLRHIVNGNGEVEDMALQNHCFSEAEKALYRTLGCTIVYKGKEFVLSNLELYYGSAGDKAHDWWKFKNGQIRGINKDHPPYQMETGPRIYLKSLGRGGRNRMDLVIGPQGVAISFLIRNLIKEDGSWATDINKGGTGVLLKEDVLCMDDKDVGKEIELIDTHNDNITSTVVRNKRFISGKGYVGFEASFPEMLWNIRLAE